MRASFSRATRPANEGAAADVPLADVERPLKKTRKFSACAETSGIACVNGTVIRQLVLSPPSVLRWKGLAYASMRIEESRVGVFGQRSEKPLHSGVLIRWPRELSRFPILVSVILEKKGGKLTMLLNPPPESSAATSGMEVVPPTAVTLWAVPKASGARKIETHGLTTGRSQENLV